MSSLFGIRQAEGCAVEQGLLQRIASATDSYAPDGTSIAANGRVGMGFQPYHTHQRSHLESKPVVNTRGDMLTFDGRLDNFKELCGLLDLKHEQAPDSMIALAAFTRWGEECFSCFVGDWALALWASKQRLIYLARDHAGTRTLYYQLRGDELLWATHLETLLAYSKDQSVDEAFAAAYLSAQPIRDLTPFRNIYAVSAAHYLAFREGNFTRKPHWVSTVKERIRYASDADYDEHFVSLFRNAVERRTGPGAPIIAELSGGMDSTSIVCMSDHIRKAQGATTADLVDTVSYYDDSEPNWDEMPYFKAVEKARGKGGLHIQISKLAPTYEPPVAMYLWPGPEKNTLAAEQLFEDELSQGKYRAILSGIGGDELLGGPPNPLPELADYLVSLKLSSLLTQGVKWALAKRVPLITLLGDVAAFAFRSYARRPQHSAQLPSWLSPSTVTLATRRRDLRPSGPTFGRLPSSIDNSSTWWSIIETLNRPALRVVARREYRYPLLDRDLVDFLVRIPPNQLIRPDRRRLLMRRALKNIVPAEVLERKRKAFVMRGPAIALAENKSKLQALLGSPQLKAHRFVERNALEAGVARYDALLGIGEQRHLMRAIQFELWMRRATSSLVQV